MARICLLLLVYFIVGCSSSQPKSVFTVEKQLPKQLKEISGLSVQGSVVWAISDNPRAGVFKLNMEGDVIQRVRSANANLTDIEAVTSDAGNIYIGDVGDNDGNRAERRILKWPVAKIPKGEAVQITGELIEFTFPDEVENAKKKNNNFDCESLISYNDSLYVFTKDREDKETRLYSLPKSAGKYTARFINSFNSEGLITDAAISPAQNELALLGYHKGHKDPFIILFSNFKGNDFFSGTHQGINLAGTRADWQLEGITYGDKNMLYFSCEATKDVPATFYGITRENLLNYEQSKNE